MAMSPAEPCAFAILWRDKPVWQRHGHKVLASPRPAPSDRDFKFQITYFKDLEAYYASGGINFVSRKQKSAIFEKTFKPLISTN
jgi:hypothetical protein